MIRGVMTVRLIAIAGILVASTTCLDFGSQEEDASLRTPELIRKYGYEVELHNVITDDGYVLTHHRIPYGRKQEKIKDKPVVLLQHGLLGSSSDWIIKTPESGLGYLLADEGYDVWLLNTRGNEYSEKHVALHPIYNRRTFWDFSWHEIGLYDLPNTIDYILNVTNQEQVLHIGHSQGTTTLYVMLSEKPEYNEKVQAHISYSPIAFHKHTISLMFRVLAPIEALGGLTALKLFIGEFNFAPSNSLLRLFTGMMCTDRETTQVLCSNIYYMLMGYNPSQMNSTMLPVIYGHFPAGSSMMQMAHYIQEINSGKFRQFDYGFAGNMQKYKRSQPPEYNCSAVRVPVHTFYGGKDAFAQLEDVERFHRLLPNLQSKTFIADWAHMDFMYGVDAAEIVYYPTMDILAQYSSLERKNFFIPRSPPKKTKRKGRTRTRRPSHRKNFI